MVSICTNSIMTKTPSGILLCNLNSFVLHVLSDIMFIHIGEEAQFDIVIQV